MDDDRLRSARRDRFVVAATALAARLAVVAWAAGRIGPAGDGVYYDALASRLARGLGYTWLWPDGAVTFAAHYPVGYPALLALGYALFGAYPVVGMVVNAAFGVALSLAAHALAARFAETIGASARLARGSGLAVALHPGLLFYTPALMTEGVAAALVACAAIAAARAKDRVSLVAGAAVLGAIVGLATLVRPESLLVGPTFALVAFAVRGPKRAAQGAAIALAASLLVVAPWTARNCVRMHRCALVSVNGGWNLLIGTNPRGHGGWSEVVVPASCRDVNDEAEKDLCFEHAAEAEILDHPAAFLALAPKKLAATFDYVGAAPWYLHASNPDAFDARDKSVLGALETIFERLSLLLSLAACARPEGPRRRARAVLAAVGSLFALTPPGFVGYAALVAIVAARGRALSRDSMLPVAAAALVLLTMITHAVFFGGGRYAIVVLPFVTALAPFAFATGAPGGQSPRDRSSRMTPA